MSSFSMLLKDELVSLDQNDKELKAMLMGLLQVNASINFLYISFGTILISDGILLPTSNLSVVLPLSNTIFLSLRL